MPRALKVFQAHLGFYDTVVAAPSQAAALKAWGSRRNLFREGLAVPSNDPKAIAAAIAKPGVVLRRPAGSSAPFKENPDLPQVPDAPKKRAAAKTKTQPPPPPRRAPAPPRARRAPPPPPDRSGLDAAEKALAELKREEEDALVALTRRRAALDDEELRTRNAFRARRKRVEETLVQARNAYRRALDRH